MKYFSWDIEKNEKLKAERNISFEEIVFYIGRGQVLDILEHPNKKKYPNQLIFVIQVEDYVYLVPFVEKENEIILKTIIPSRKATKHYLRGDD
jgi:uncharacterized DUF497 family protein